MKTGVLVIQLIEIWPSFSLLYLIFKETKCLRTFSQEDMKNNIRTEPCHVISVVNREAEKALP